MFHFSAADTLAFMTSTRVAVVTGGAGAIGGAIVAELTASGHAVVSLDAVGDPAVDLASEDQVRAAAARVLADHGRCDVLVHAAACFDRADLASVDLAGWRRVQAVNVESALMLAQAFAPGMAERGFGRIVFVVSDTVWSPPAADMLAYVSSKGTLIGLARTLAVGLGADGIAVTCVAPGLTDTPAARAGNSGAAFDDVRSRQALPRTLVPGDVASTVGFLVTDAAAALTGQTLCVDGGLILRLAVAPGTPAERRYRQHQPGDGPGAENQRDATELPALGRLERGGLSGQEHRAHPLA